MKSVALRICLAVVLLAVQALASAAPVEVEFGAVWSAAGEAAGLLDVPLEPAGELLQLRVGRDIVLSAARGARLAILRNDGTDAGTLVVVLSEPVVAVDTAANRLAVLGVGSHFLRDGAAQGEWAVALAPAGAQRPPGMAGIAPLLGDAVMLRQQAYLDSLRIDVQPLNRAIASFIRKLFPTPGK